MILIVDSFVWSSEEDVFSSHSSREHEAEMIQRLSPITTENMTFIL